MNHDVIQRPALFLDFDGVLNTFDGRRRSPDGWNELDPILVARAKRVIDITNALVVVSSSWRLHEGKEPIPRLTKILQDNGFVHAVHDVTPYLSGKPRGLEIAAWIESSGHRGNIAIVDDDDDMVHLLPYLVRTDDYYGVQEEHVRRLVGLLRS